VSEAHISFIGGGNMARSVAIGLLNHGYDPATLCVSNRGADKLDFFDQELGVYTTQDNNEAAEETDVVIIAVKPQQSQGVCEEIKDKIQQHQPLIISLAAGVTTKLLQGD